MWKQYKKTFWGMQAVMLWVAGAVLLLTRLLSLAMFFFLVMQISAVIGAAWANRLNNRRRRATGTLFSRSQ